MSTDTAAAPAHPVTDLALRRALLDTARASAESVLRQPVRFKVDRLTIAGDAAFLLARMEDAEGRPVSFAGTPLDEAAQQGFVSQIYAALLKRAGGGWTVVVKAIGPGDVAWEGWAREYAVPTALFRP